MIDLDTILVISAFIAGVLMFLAPCTLPLIPGYIIFISGFKNTPQAKASYKVLGNSVAFILGFSVVFIAFGILLGFVGSSLVHVRLFLAQFGGVAIIILGLLMLQVIRIPFLSKVHITKFPSFVRPGHPTSAFLMGSVFATGWSPCIGPVLASILLLASTKGSVLMGGFLLAVFSLGLAIPFFVTALLLTRVEPLLVTYPHVFKILHEIGAFFIIAVGVLLVTDNFDQLVVYGFRLLDFIGYESLLRFY